MTHFFGFLIHTKVAKLVLSGEPVNFQPFGLNAEGLLFFMKLFL